MGRVSRLTIGILAALMAILLFAETMPEALMARFLPINSDIERFVVVAHRGASSCAPQNTMAAFRKGIELGANGVEMDVQFTRDGVPVVAHPTTTVVGEMNYEKVASIDAGEGEPVPLLSEALALFRRHVERGDVTRIYLHDKQENDYSGAKASRIEVFADMIRRAELLNHAVVMVESGDVDLWQRLAPDVQLIQNWTGPTHQPNRFPIEQTDRLGLQHIGIYHRPAQLGGGWMIATSLLGLKNIGTVLWFWPDRSLIAEYANKEFVVFTLNKPLLMRLYLHAGFDAIGTDDVLLLRQILAGDTELTPGLCEAL